MATKRVRHPSIGESVAGLVRAPYVAGLGELLEGSRVGRRRKHPQWVPMAYAALARHFRSANRLDGELANGLWDVLRRDAVAAGLQDPGAEPYTYPQHAYWRERVVRDAERREELLEAFTTFAIGHARSTGLLLPKGQGSLTHPHPSRTIYGDGTVVRPIYRKAPPPDQADDGQDPAVDTSDAGGKAEEPSGRQDESAAVFHRHDGPIRGNDFVCFYARGETAGSRIVLGVDRVDAPGREADTAVALIERIAGVAGGGIQAVVYDGAFKGVHIDDVMRRFGFLVVNRLAAAVRTEEETVAKRRALGTFEHKVGRRKCAHHLHVDNGTVVDIALADDGTPTTVGRATRKQVKRVRRADGSYRFQLGVEIPCRRGPFTLWLSPHATKHGDNLPEHLRLLPPDDADFTRLYGLRNDSESFNSQFKRTLLVDRAASVGWERQLFDVLCFAVLQNSLAWVMARQTAERPALRLASDIRRSA